LSLPWLEPVDLDAFARLLSNSPHAIVSSEAFQDLDPAEIVDVFPPGKTTVVVYLREQVDYLVTWYAQEIQSNLETRAFAEFAAAVHLDLEYGWFLDSWAAVFGETGVLPRVYDRSLLQHGDAIDDFMAAIGVGPIDGFARKAGDANVSLSALLTTTKRLLNRVLTPEQHRDWDLYASFGRLATADTSLPRRIPVSPLASRALRDRYRRDNEYVSQRYFGATQDVFRYPAFDEAGQLNVADSDIATMLLGLKECAPLAAELLTQTVANTELLRTLPLDERNLARRIDYLQETGSPGSGSHALRRASRVDIRTTGHEWGAHASEAGDTP
jgi:hypothetical protein